MECTPTRDPEHKKRGRMSVRMLRVKAGHAYHTIRVFPDTTAQEALRQVLTKEDIDPRYESMYAILHSDAVGTYPLRGTDTPYHYTRDCQLVHLRYPRCSLARLPESVRRTAYTSMKASVLSGKWHTPDDVIHRAIALFFMYELGAKNNGDVGQVVRNSTDTLLPRDFLARQPHDAHLAEMLQLSYEEVLFQLPPGHRAEALAPCSILILDLLIALLQESSPLFGSIVFDVRPIEVADFEATEFGQMLCLGLDAYGVLLFSPYTLALVRFPYADLIDYNVSSTDPDVLTMRFYRSSNVDLMVLTIAERGSFVAFLEHFRSLWPLDVSLLLGGGAE